MRYIERTTDGDLIFTMQSIAAFGPRCPKCRSSDVEVTTKGQLFPGRDPNTARCESCGWNGGVIEALG